jgi:GcrA cell cycle regulator
MTVWDVPGLVDDLKIRVNAGSTCSRIASELNDKFSIALTRNAVIGKMQRLGLVKPGPPLPPSPPPKPPRRRKPPQQIARAAVVSESAMTETEPTDHDLDIPLAQRRALFDLENHHCRWPIGNPGHPGFFFCGATDADLAGSRPYCAYHDALSRPPPAQRRAPMTAGRSPSGQPAS